MALRRSVIKQAGCPAVVQLRLRPTADQAARLEAAVGVCFNRDARTASVWTPKGRVHVSYTSRGQDLKAIQTLPIEESDLIERNGCGLAGHADHFAAINIANRGVDGRGAANRPHATGLPSPRRAPESKPQASACGR